MSSRVQRHVSQRARRSRALDFAVRNTLETLEPRMLLSTTYVVNNPADTVAADGFITLREALQAANTDTAVFDAPAGSGADTITFAPALFAPGPNAIVLNGTRLSITSDLTITGPGADRLTVDAGGGSRVFDVGNGVTAAISALTVTGGQETLGGGIRNSGVLTIDGVAVYGNAADLEGGGVYNARGATLNLSNSAVWGNSAGYYGGGVRFWGTATIVNTTISSNSCEQFGGGIYTSGTLTVVNATIAANRADSQDTGFGLGGGIDVGAGTATLYNTIVAGNFVGTGATVSDVQGAFQAAGSRNLIGVTDGSTGLSGGAGTRSGTAAAPLDARLSALGDHGGTTPTHALLPGSPAFDAGSNAQASAWVTDQRGAGFPRFLYGTVDIGAVECTRAGSIGDLVWNDKDVDGVQDAGENGIAGVMVRLYQDDGDGIFAPATDTLLDTQVTTADGYYDFLELSPGNYWVSVDGASAALAGFVFATGTNPRLVNLADSQDYSEAGFGYSNCLFIVSTLADELDGDYSAGDFSLREAINLANGISGHSVIEFAAGLPYDPTILGGRINIDYALGGFTINGDVEIRGPGSNLLTITGGDLIYLRVSGGTATISGLTVMGQQNGCGVDVDSGATVTLSGVTITGGLRGLVVNIGGVAIVGGCTVEGRGDVISNLGQLTLTGSNIEGNNGVGVLNQGPAVVEDCLISGNGNGGVENHSKLTLVNTTVTGNGGGSNIGGIYNVSGSLSLTNCTVTGNVFRTAYYGGQPGEGILNAEGGSAVLQNTIVAGNGWNQDVSGSFGPGSSHNLIGVIDNSSSGLDHPGNLYGTQAAPLDPMLGPLADNFGPTKTHALRPWSPAVDAGSNALAVDASAQPLTTDQRGTGFSRISGVAVDIGAYERQGATIGGRTWNDWDGDGVRDPAEPDISGATLRVYRDDGDGIFQPGGADVLVDTQTTEAGEYYGFVGLSAGDYWAQIDEASPPLSGCVRTMGANPQLVTVTAEQNYLAASFGYHRPLIVSTLADENDGNYSDGHLSLREAIALANSIPIHHVIEFAAGLPYDPTILGGRINIDYALGGFTINGDVEIRGPGSNLLTITGGDLICLRVSGGTATISGLTVMAQQYGNGVDVDSGATVTLSGVTITGWRRGLVVAIGGVAIVSGCTVEDTSGTDSYGISNSGQLTLTGSKIEGNAEWGIVNQGPAVVEDCFISGNWYNGVENYSKLTLVNTTVTGNGRQGIYNVSGDLVLTNCTVTGNVPNPYVAEVAGIRNNGSQAVVLNNTIVAGNGSNQNLDVAGTFDASSSHNLIGAIDNSSGLNNSGNLYGTQAAPLDPMLGPLANNYGTLQTYALLPLSPAIDAGSNALAVDHDGVVLTTDQRGPGFSRIVGPTVDIGAFELSGGASIGDRVWNDHNADGVQGVGEEGIAGVAVRLYADDGDGVYEPGTGDTLITTRTTTTDGAYEIPALSPGTYWVDVDQTSAPLNGYVLTTGNDPLLVQLATGEDFNAADFGFYSPLIVSTLADENDGNYTPGHLSLREALLLADSKPGYNVIFFAPALTGGTIALAPGRGQLQANRDMAIQGPGANLLTLDAQGYSRVLSVADGASVQLSGMTLKGGASNVGAGLYIDSGAQVIAADLEITGCIAAQRGGGIYVAYGATLALSDSLVTTCSSGHQGGGIFVDYQAALTVTRSAVVGNTTVNAGGGVYSDGTLSLADTTVSANRSDRHGGGVYADLGTVALTSVTVAFNLADANIDGSGDGGGLYLLGGGTLSNTIVASNTRGAAIVSDVFGNLDPAGTHNLIASGAAGLNAADNLLGTVAAPLDAALMPLDTYNGWIPVHALRPESPALDAGSNAASASLATDQNGLPRRRDHDGDGNAVIDIGASESGPVITITGALDETIDSDGLRSLREALQAAAAVPGFDAIRFAPTLFSGGNALLPLALGELSIASNVEILGPTDARLTIDAAGTGRVLHVQAGVLALLGNMTLRGGSATDGGGVYNTGRLSLSAVSLIANSATRHGGGIYNQGTLSLANTTISGNSARQSGGGVYQETGSLSVTNATIVWNVGRSNDGSVGDGGGLYVAAGSAVLGNTLVAENTRGSGTTANDAWGIYTSSAYNLIGAIDGSTGLAGAGARYGTVASPLDPLLTSLADHGGPIFTYGLQPASPLTDAGSNPLASAAGLSTDARGLPRVRDGLDSGVARVDIGAFEQQVPLNQAPTVTIVQTLQGAVETVPFRISCDYLLARSDASDPENAPVGFKILTVTAGTLTLNSVPIIIGQTILLPGQSLVWTPPAITFGTEVTKTLAAFTVAAWDGQVASSTSAPVSIQVTSVGEKVNYAVLFSGGDRVDLNYPIYYENLKRTYQTLVTQYGLQPYNIYVIYADGRDPGPDMKGNLNSDMSFAANVLPATHDNLRDTLASVSSRIDANDRFFFWAYDHGLGATNQPSTTGEEIIKGWGSGQQINGDELRVWLQGLKPADSAANYPGIAAGYHGIQAAYSTYMFAECFSGGMLSTLSLDATHFGVAASNHYEASYADYFVSAFTSALQLGYNNTGQAFAYASEHDGRALVTAEANSGSWSFNVEHPWSGGGSFAIFATPNNLNASPEIRSIAPLKIAASATDLTITYDMLMAAADTASPTGQAIRFWVDGVDGGQLYRDGVLLNPGDAAQRTIAYGQCLTWHRPAGTSGTLGAFRLKVLDPEGTPVGAAAVVFIRIGENASGLIGVNDNATLQQNTSSMLLTVLANDQGVSPHVLRVGVAAHGQVSFDSATGQVRYTPAAEYLGSDTFTYLISDGVSTDLATVSLSVVSYDPAATVSFAARFASTEMLPPPGWAGLPDSWDWPYRSTGIPDWTETFAVGLSDDGVVAVSTRRTNPNNGSIDYVGSTNAGYRWQSGDTEPFWNSDQITTGGITQTVTATNTFMLLLPAVNSDGTPLLSPQGRQIFDGVAATAIDVPTAMPGIRYLDPNNANESGFPPLGGIWFDPGTNDEIWQNMPSLDYSVIDVVGVPSNSGSIYYAALNNNGATHGDYSQAELWSIDAANPQNTHRIAILAGWQGNQHSFARSMNANGHIVGYAEDTNAYHAFLYDGTQMVNLGTLAGQTHSFATAANDHDTVVGYASNTLPNVADPSANEHTGMAFTWDSTHGMTSLGTLSSPAGATGWSVADDLNNDGLIVGASDGHAVLWAQGTILDLNSLADGLPAGVVLTEATGINASGQIVATGVLANGSHRAFFLDIKHTLSVAADTVATGSRTSVSFNVLDNDTGAASVTSVSTTGLSGTLTWSASGDMIYSPVGAFPTLAVGQSTTTSFTYTAQGATTPTSVTITVTGQSTLDTFHVTDFAPTASGFEVTLSAALDISKLNLYDGIAGTKGAADVSLTSTAHGAIRGSAFWDAPSRTLHFIATGGPLAPDVYTVTLASRTNGIVSSAGHLLDGNANNIDGDDYSATFTVAPSTTRVVSLPDFARGPTQAVSISSGGIPVRIDNAQDALSIQFAIDYNPQLLNIVSVTLASGLPAGWQALPNLTTPGHAIIGIFGTQALPAGARDLVILNATVPAEAAYTAAESIVISNLFINEGAINAVADTAIHKVVYLGDASGNGAFSTTDAAYIARVGVLLDSGLDKSPLVDPAIIADVTGKGSVSVLDAAYVAQYLAGFTVPSIPAPGPAPATVSGLDPTVEIGSQTVYRGATVPIQVRITDNAAGLIGATLHVHYDTTRFQLANADVALNPAFGGWNFVPNVDDAAGTATFVFYGTSPLPAGPADLLTLNFHVDTAAALGTSALTLTGQLDAANDAVLPMTIIPGQLTIASATLDVSPANITLLPGQTQQFSATGTLAWTATGGTITPAGLFTAGTQGGVFTVTANASNASGSVAVAIFTPQLPGTSGNDTYTVRLAANHQTLEIFTGPAFGIPTYCVDSSNASSLTFALGDGDDCVIIDGTNGTPIGPYGLVFDFGSGSNTLTLNGGTYFFGSNFFDVPGDLNLIITAGTEVTIGDPPADVSTAPISLNGTANALFALMPMPAPTLVASRLAFVQQPTDATVGRRLNQPVTVEVLDQYGDLLATDDSNVTLQAIGGPGSLNGTTTVAAAHGIATFRDLAIDAAGKYTLEATDPTLSAAASDRFAIGRAASFLALTSSTNPSTYGQSVKFTANVTSTGRLPAGTVQFQIDGRDFGMPVLLVSGSAISDATSVLGIGSHNISAIYIGDATYDPSNDASVLIVVPPAETTPLTIALTSNIVRENEPAGTLVGDLTETGASPSETFTYALVPGDGSRDNTQFTVYGNMLKTTRLLDYEQCASYSVRVNASGNLGTSIEMSLTINVQLDGAQVTPVAGNMRSFFDEKFYLACNPDVKAAVTSGAFASGWDHFLTFGQYERRQPSAFYDDYYYRMVYNDVDDAVLSRQIPSGFYHFVMWGMNEHRRGAAGHTVAGTPIAGDPWSFFNENYYLANNPDVKAAVDAKVFVSGFQHFMAAGQFEGRRPSALFNETWYLQHNPDVAAAVHQGDFRSGFAHFLLFGFAEGRLGAET